MANRFDIRRQVQAIDTILGGVTITTTAIETRVIELQTLNGQDIVRLGGMRLEATYKGFCHKDTNIRETDVITSDSGTTRYEIVFYENLFDEHVQFFAKKVE